MSFLFACSCRDTHRKLSTEEPITADVFENIQMHLDMIEGIRSKPWTMDEKLEVLRHAKKYVEEHSGDLNRLQHFTETRIRFIRQIKRQFQNFIVFFIPWEKRIKNIQGYFGAGIGSFFLFLRSLVWINFILLVFISVFVVAPQLLSPSTAMRLPESEKRTAQRLTTVLDAKGYLEYSFLFYGYYGNEYIHVGAVKYPLPLAYFVVFMGTYLFSIIIVLRAIVREQRLVKSSGQNDHYPFGWRVFSAWDFLITERETADNKLASLTTAIREQILEAVEKGKTTNKKSLIALRVLANVLVLGVLAASAFLIYLVVKRSDERGKNGKPPTVLEQYEISLAITGMNAVCPVFFKLIAMIEKYHPRVALYWELTRIMFLYLGNMYVLVISLLNKINKTKETFPSVSSDTKVGNATVSPVTMVALNTTTGSLCWETTVGQELFKLTVIDLVALVFSVITSELFVSLAVRFLNCFQGRLLDLEKILGYPEFKLAENVLQLINSQGLIWMGLVFSPGLIMLNILKLVIIMYLRSWAIMVTNVPPKRIFKASHQFYLLLLLVMLFLCLLAVGYAVVEIEPSRWCGPFRGKHNMYIVVTEAIDNGPSLLNTVFDYLSGPSVVIPVLIIMTIAIYYYRSKANYLQSSNRDLMLQLHHERTEDRKKIFRRASEHVNLAISKTDTNFNRLQNHENTTPERENYNSFVGETTSSHQKDKLPKRGSRMSAQSFSQLVSDVPTKGQAQCADLTPIVTYDGNEETPAPTAKATSKGYSHREVKVIVHNKKTHSSTSSSSSTCSSVRSFGQRRHPVKHHFDRPRDCSPLLASHQTEKRNSERSDFSPAENKAVGSQHVSSTCIDERNAECEETIELQVVTTVNNASDTTDGDSSNAEANEDRITKQGGSLADMFDT
ncbi:unnamed protein product [Porites lobata]|uniref:TMC domain-containing protein n=1 Tax=Porites lobata TaxID=104759 RepID=A0ABN8NHX9_9CNID|nr:unnamed protein product [Porites lobata]